MIAIVSSAFNRPAQGHFRFHEWNQEANRTNFTKVHEPDSSKQEMQIEKFIDKYIVKIIIAGEAKRDGSPTLNQSSLASS